VKTGMGGSVRLGCILLLAALYAGSAIPSTEHAVQRLEAAATIYDEAEMAAAADALVEIGRDAVPRLMKAAVHDDRNVRWQAIVALGRIGSPAADPAVHSITSALTNDSDPDVRSGAAEALGRLRLRSEAVFTALLQGTGDAHGKVRADAHWALAQVRNHPPAVPALTTLLEAKDWMVSETAARHLASMGADARPALVAKIKADFPGRAAAVSALGKMDPAVLGPALRPLLQGLDDNDPVVAAACAQTLGHMDKLALAGLRKYLAAAAPKNPAGALRALGACKSAGSNSLAIVLPYLHQNQADVRLAAIRCIAGIGSAASPAVNSLVALLSNADADIRAAAAAALGRTGGVDADCRAQLRKLADSDVADHVRAAAALTLTKYPRD
jgi:HEAT repeat protein